MATVFLLLFFVCIFGVFRPFKGFKRQHFGLAAFACFILVGVTAPDPSGTKSHASSATPPAVSAEQVAAMEAKNVAEIAKLKKEASVVPASNADENLRIYSRLVELAPANIDFANKKSRYELKIAARARYAENPEEALEITDFDWSKGGFGSVMTIDRLAVRNDAPFAIKDFVVKCVHQGPSGTDMDSNTRKIYEIVPAGQTKTIRDINMGFIHSQASTSRCEITGGVAG